MTVRELIHELLAYGMDAQVIIAKDREGSRHSPAADLEYGRYTADTTWSGDFTPQSGLSCGGFGGTPAVVIRPVN